MKILNQRAHTLLEILIATMLIGAIFVVLASLYVSSLKLFNNETNFSDVNSLLALETITRKISIANQAIIDSGGSQIKLRIDNNSPATLTTADDQWVSYAILPNGANFQLRTKTPSASPANVALTDPEVVPGLVFLNTTATPSRFDLINPTNQGDPKSPTVVKVQLTMSYPSGIQSRTFLSSVALKSSK